MLYLQDQGDIEMDEKERFIADWNHGHEMIAQLLQDLEATHRESSELYPTWTIKELLAHLAGWDDACIASLRAFARGDAPATPASRGIDPYNASTVHEREALSLDHVIKEWSLSRKEFIAAIRELPDEKVSEAFVMPWGSRGTLADMVKIFAEHDVEHAEEIRAKHFPE